MTVKDTPQNRDLLEAIRDLVARSMPRNMERLAPILERMEKTAAADPAAIGDPTYRQIEEWHFGKPGRVPADYFVAAAREFIARVEGDNAEPRKAVRKAIIADVMAKFSITENYAKRCLADAIKDVRAGTEKTAK